MDYRINCSVFICVQHSNYLFCASFHSFVLLKFSGIGKNVRFCDAFNQIEQNNLYQSMTLSNENTAKLCHVNCLQISICKLKIAVYVFRLTFNCVQHIPEKKKSKFKSPNKISREFRKSSRNDRHKICHALNTSINPDWNFYWHLFIRFAPLAARHSTFLRHL